MEIGLLLVVAIVIATLALLHLVANEMEEGPPYPNSAPVVKAVSMLGLYRDHRVVSLARPLPPLHF